jgi:hypothetical protein
MDPTDPDPQHWKILLCIIHAGSVVLNVTLVWKEDRYAYCARS